jgi:predicted RNA-binding Zn-ribbon protein involved in translation (DUF1610 family)
MKVLKKGRKQKGWAEEYNCTGKGNGHGGCGARLLIEQGDVYMTYSSDMYETESHHTFACPECGVETDIDRVPFTPVSKQTYLRNQK